MPECEKCWERPRWQDGKRGEGTTSNGKKQQRWSEEGCEGWRENSDGYGGPKGSKTFDVTCSEKVFRKDRQSRRNMELVAKGNKPTNEQTFKLASANATSEMVARVAPGSKLRDAEFVVKGLHAQAVLCRLLGERTVQQPNRAVAAVPPWYGGVAAQVH